MSELETKTEAEVEDFTDELSDEALDRGACGVISSNGSTMSATDNGLRRCP